MRGIKQIKAICLVVTIMAGSALASPTSAPDTQSEGISDVTAAFGDWRIKSADNICGVSSSTQITNPAKVDYAKLMAATSEMKEIRREEIDKKSARGQALMTKAVARVLKASKRAMGDKGHCSVWKKISHKDGNKVTDLTRAVLDNID
ncbi:MAG: hypothetical protein ACI8X5_000122 [Planctomycetota bacterium]|jgi:hypothetical protein